MVGSVPGLLDTISCGSIVDLTGGPVEEESAVPNILCECIRHLEQNGLHTLGIFRVSTSKKRIRQVSSQIIPRTHINIYLKSNYLHWSSE